MPQALAKKIIVSAVLLMVGVFVVIFIALPFFASTQIVRDRISHQLTAWSGYRVSIDGAPELHIWPTFRAVLKDVQLQDWDERSSRPILEAEQIEIDLSAVAALRGDVVFNRMHLVRPTLRIRDGTVASQLPSPESWGRIARSVLTAKSILAASPLEPNLQAFHSDTFGEITFMEARIVTNEGENNINIVSGLEGELNWPALNRAATVNAKGIWQGESVTLRAASAQPLLLLAGGTAPLSIDIESAPATLSFQGKTTLAESILVDGDLELVAPSLNRLAEWTRIASLPGSRIGPFSIAARLSGTDERLKLEASNLAIDTSVGRGLLEINLSAPQPSIAGTLAFNTLNLLAVTTALNPLKQINAALGQGSAPSAAQSFDFDMRLSATTAHFGSLVLNEVAAATKGSQLHSSFDITDATAFGGSFQLGIRADRTGEQQQVELRFNGSQIDTSILAQAFGRQHLIPQAKADISAILKGTGSTIDSLLSTSEGEVSAQFGSGKLPGINLENLIAEAKKGDFIPLNQSSPDSIAIEGIDIKATLRNGLAQIDQAVIKSGNYTASLQGRVPVAGRALALFGQLTEKDTEANAPLHFFIGGSWNAPFITSPTSFHSRVP